jgi:hypothetical protein
MRELWIWQGNVIIQLASPVKDMNLALHTKNKLWQCKKVTRWQVQVRKQQKPECNTLSPDMAKKVPLGFQLKVALANPN